MGLVERDAVMAELRASLAACATGFGTVAVIRGGIASGKTALLRNFEEHAIASGATLLRATGAPGETSLRFGVVEQLFRGATARPEVTALLTRLAQLATPQVGDEWPSLAQGGTSGASGAKVAHDLCMGLLEVSRQGPLLISVDDHQFADPASMQVLTYLQHRIGTAPVMLLLSQGTEPPSELVREVLRQQYSRQFMLSPLSPEGVGQLLEQRLESSAALAHAPGSYAVTGGNPWLTHALIDDIVAGAQDAAATAVTEPVTGPAFSRAVLAMLHRGGPLVLRTARAIAVLGEFAAPALLARLLDVRLSVVGGALEAMERAGLTTNAQFRYHGTRGVVLDELMPEEHSELNRRAAELLDHEGAAPSDVVGYLLAAGEADEPWAARVLHAAADQTLAYAEQALAQRKVGEAVQYLEFASRSCDDEHQRAMLTARLAWVQWTISPAAAARHHGPLQKALDKELLSSLEAMRLARSLAWHGQTKEAVRALARVGASLEDEGPRDLAERTLTRQWLSTWYPQIFAQAEEHGALADPVSSPAPARGSQPGVRSLGATRPSAVEGAEQVLQTARVRDTELASVMVALQELLAAESCERALYWCDELLKKVEGQHTATWQGVLLDTRAAARLRLGDLAEAERDAGSALTALSARSWGVAIGSPLSHAVQAATMRGHFERAAELLNQVVPQSMMETRYGLQYRMARGQFYLATNRPRVALQDFEAVGGLAVKWKLDHPVDLPWRGDLAQALVKVGETDRAQELIKDQLHMIGSDSTRMRGISLGLLASVSDLKQRLPLLSETVGLLQAGGDRYQLARAFVALGEVWQVLGKLDRAQLIRRRALQLAESCHADQLSSQLLATRVTLNSEPTPSQWEDAESMAVLSEAERRVAALAALGRTNREIGGMLYITVSTVEQHLTRVYRKLNIKRRADLPVGLSADIA